MAVLAITAFLMAQAPVPTDGRAPPMPALGPCAIRGARMVSTIASLPPAVREELARFFRPGFELAEAGAPFQSTDVVLPGAATRRFLRAVLHGERVAIWYESGGIAYNRHVLGVRLSRSPRGQVARVEPNARFIGYTGDQLCRATQAYFDGVMSTDAN